MKILFALLIALVFGLGPAYTLTAEAPKQSPPPGKEDCMTFLEVSVGPGGMYYLTNHHPRKSIAADVSGREYSIFPGQKKAIMNISYHPDLRGCRFN